MTSAIVSHHRDHNSKQAHLLWGWATIFAGAVNYRQDAWIHPKTLRNDHVRTLYVTLYIVEI
jgi:hypothetical protein